MISIQDFLIAGTFNYQNMAEDLSSLSNIIFPVMIVAGCIWEQMSELNFNRLIKSIFLAFLLSVYGPAILKSGVELSFQYSDGLLGKYAKDSLFLAIFEKEVGQVKNREVKKPNYDNMDKFIIRKTGADLDTHSTKDGGVTWNNLTKAANHAVLSTYGGTLILLGYFALLIVSHAYTMVYSLLLIFIPLLSSISIFQPFSSARQGILTSAAWCILTPLFSTILICLVSQFSTATIDGTLPDLSTLRMMIQFLVYLSLLFLVPFIATAFISQKGISAIGENIANSASTATLAAGQNYILGKATGGASFALSAISKGMGSLKSNISKDPYSSSTWQLKDFISKMNTGSGPGISIGQNESKPIHMPLRSFSSMMKNSSGFDRSETPTNSKGNDLTYDEKVDKNYNSSAPKKSSRVSKVAGIGLNDSLRRVPHSNSKVDRTPITKQAFQHLPDVDLKARREMDLSKYPLNFNGKKPSNPYYSSNNKVNNFNRSNYVQRRRIQSGNAQA